MNALTRTITITTTLGLLSLSGAWAQTDGAAQALSDEAKRGTHVHAGQPTTQADQVLPADAAPAELVSKLDPDATVPTYEERFQELLGGMRRRVDTLLRLPDARLGEALAKAPRAVTPELLEAGLKRARGWLSPLDLQAAAKGFAAMLERAQRADDPRSSLHQTQGQLDAPGFIGRLIAAAKQRAATHARSGGAASEPKLPTIDEPLGEEPTLPPYAANPNGAPLSHGTIIVDDE